MEWFQFGWQFLIIAALVFANGFFVAAEFALVKVRATQLRPLVKSGSWRAGISVNILNHLNAYLSMCQLGITLASLGLGWAGEPFVARWLEPVFNWSGLDDEVTRHRVSYVLAFFIISFLHIVVGEQAPKSFAIQYPKLTTLWVTPALAVLYYLFLPAIWVLNTSSNWLLRILGIPPASDHEHGFSHEELGYLLNQSSHVHPSDAVINKLLVKSLKMKETTAEQIMIPREKVFVLWRGKSVEENMMEAQKAGFSRMPLCGDSLDDLIGVVHIKELLWQHQVLGANTDLKAIARPILTLTPKTKLPTMLEFFRQSRSHLAAVIAENDELLGIVSFEDVLEELVGDIRDEFDIEKGPFFEKTDRMVLVDASISLRDVAIEMSWPLPTDTTDTVEQWCSRQWGYHAPKGRTVMVDGIRVTAEDVTPRGLRRVRLEKIEEPAEGNESGGD